MGTTPRDHRPPTANHRQPPTANHRQPPTANHRQPPTANRQPPLSANHQPPNGRRFPFNPLSPVVVTVSNTHSAISLYVTSSFGAYSSRTQSVSQVPMSGTRLASVRIYQSVGSQTVGAGRRGAVRSCRCGGCRAGWAERTPPKRRAPLFRSNGGGRGPPPPPPDPQSPANLGTTVYIWKVGTSEHWRKHRDSRLAKTRTHCCELAEEQWLEVSMAGTSSSAYRPIEAPDPPKFSDPIFGNFCGWEPRNFFWRGAQQPPPLQTP